MKDLHLEETPRADVVTEENFWGWDSPAVVRPGHRVVLSTLVNKRLTGERRLVNCHQAILTIYPWLALERLALGL